MWLVRTIWRFALLGMWCTVASATELKQIEFKVGTEGLRPIPIVIRNAGPQAIACTAEYAHWYSSEIGTAEAGTNLSVALWFETATGTYIMLNARQENLPVERLWCGIAGHAYVTRAVVPLQRNAGATISGRTVTCSTDAGRARCE